MKKIITLLLLSIVLIAQDRLEFSIADTDDVGILMIFNQKYLFKQISGTSYYGSRSDNKDLTNFLQQGKNYLIFFIFNISYHSCIYGKWYIHYGFFLNNNKLLDIEDGEKDNKNGCPNDFEKTGIKRVDIYEVTKNKNGSIQMKNVYSTRNIYNKEVHPYKFFRMLVKYDLYFRNLYIKNKHYPNYRYDQGIGFSNHFKQYIEEYYKKFHKYSHNLTIYKIQKLLSKNILYSDVKINNILFDEAGKNIEKDFKDRNLRQLRRTKRYIPALYAEKYNLDKKIGDIYNQLERDFLESLDKRNLRNAKKIISLGLNHTSNYQKTKELYAKMVKIYNIEKRYMVKIKIDITDLEKPIEITKQNLIVGKIDKSSSHQYLATCSYGKKHLDNNTIKASEYIVKNCKKRGLECFSMDRLHTCIYIYNYQKKGYIKALQQNAKKQNHLWSAYLDSPFPIDEYSTFKNEYQLLKRINTKP